MMNAPSTQQKEYEEIGSKENCLESSQLTSRNVDAWTKSKHKNKRRKKKRIGCLEHNEGDVLRNPPGSAEAAQSEAGGGAG